MKKLAYILFLPIASYGLTIDQAVQKALNQNLNLKEYKQDIKANQYQLKEDKQLWFPQFFVSYSYTMFKDTPYTQIPISFGSISPPPFKQFNKQFSNFDIGINYPIFTGFQRINKIKISKSQIKSSKYMYQEQENEIKAKVEKAYLNVLMAEDALNIYKSQKKAVSYAVKKAKEQYKEGLRTKVDVLQAKVKLSKVERDIKKAEGNLKIAKAYLNNLLNQDINKDFQVEHVNWNIPKNLNLEKLQELAIRNRKIINALSEQEKQAEYLYKINQASFYPQVVAQAKYNYSNQSPYLDPKGNYIFAIALNLEFQGIKPYYASLKTKELEKKLVIKINQLKNNIKLQVKSAYENFLTAQKNLDIAENTLKEAEEYYKLVKGQYENQLADMTDLLNAESSYTAAKRGRMISYYELLKAFVDLEKAVGVDLNEK